MYVGQKKCNDYDHLGIKGECGVSGEDHVLFGQYSGVPDSAGAVVGVDVQVNVLMYVLL